MRKFCKKLALSFVFFILFSFVSCQEKPDMPSLLDNYTSQVINRTQGNGSITNGRYIYLSGSYGVGLRRYDRITGEMTTACIASDCDGNCYVERMAFSIAGITDNKILFSTSPKQSGTEEERLFWGYATYDIVTGKEKLLIAMNHYEFVNESVVPWNGCVYYTKKVLREGGDAKNSKDYVPALCRIPLSGDGGEKVVSYLDEMILPYFAVENHLYYLDGVDLWKMNLITGEKKILVDALSVGYTSIVAHCVYDDYIYCTVAKGETHTDEFGNTYTRTYIGRVNTNTGAYETLVEYSGNFLVTEQGIYFGKPEAGVYLYIPPEEKKDKEATIYNEMPTLCFCNHDGSGVKEVFSRDIWNYENALYAVVGDILYIGVQEYDEATHSWGSSALCAVNLKDGSYTKSEYKKD